jgi:tripartite ATP-independent transporter DctM subunit
MNNNAETGTAASVHDVRTTDVAKIVEHLLEAASIGLMLVAVGVASLQVTLRYAFNSGLPWPEELATWVFGWAVFLGMAVATRREAHISIDVVLRLLGPRSRAAFEFFGHAVVAACSVMLMIHGYDYMSRVISASPALQLPMKFFFLAVPVGGFFNLFFLLWPKAGRSFVTGAGVVGAGLALYAAVRWGGPLIYDQETSGIVLVLFGVVSIAIGVPVAFALSFGTFAAFAPFGPMLMMTISQNMAASLNSFTLLAIPFFILAAAVMNAGGITPRLVDLAMQLVGHLRGGLGQANVVTNTMLAGISGSSTADASTIAKLLVPEMAARGYSRPFASALTAAAATIANLIPPSLGLIVYAALASVSVGALFVATIIPGLMASAALMITVWVISRARGYGGDIPKATLEQRMTSLGLAIPALILPALIVGGVRFGVFTATEAGAIAFLYALFCGSLLYRKLTVANLVAAIRESVFDTAVIVVIIAAAAPFAWVLAFEQVPQTIAEHLAVLVERPWLLMLAINGFLLVVGLFMEMIASMVILVPILVPLVVAAGFDPIQFGVVLVINLVIGALTPPLGVLVFTTARVGGANQTETFKAITPFTLALIVVLMLVTFVPAFTLLPVALLGP